MNDEEFRDALRAAASVARPTQVRVDPAAARRAGDVRVRTRTAVTTSLAFSLVILAGFGAVFFAAHRSRPTTLGSDGSPVPTASPTPSRVALTPLSAYWTPVDPMAGSAALLTVQGESYGTVPAMDIIWGDGTHGGYSDPADCRAAQLATGPPTDIRRIFEHTYAEPGNYTISVTARPCSGPMTASFDFPVVPAAIVPSVAVAPSTMPSTQVPTMSPTPTATRSPSASPKTSPSASPTASVSRSRG